MAVRILLLVAAVALVVAGVTRERAHDACQDARFDTLSVNLHKLPATDAAGIATRLAGHCRDVDELVNGVVVFSKVGATNAAQRLAADAVAREPKRRNSWLALATVRQRVGDASGAARARARAVALDPVGLRGSLNRSSGRSTK
jgi:cytochrome c-type biogenesis protein CcmH/NrfG